MATDKQIQITNDESTISVLPDFMSIKIQKGSMIEKVPEILRQHRANETCFAPSFITFGPYHHGKQDLDKRGQEVKIQLMQKLYKGEASSSYTEDYYKVEAVASEAQKCYSDDSTKQFKHIADFAKMMFLDGCAFLQFISSCVNTEKENTDWNDLDIKDHEIGLIIQDMFLLENQLPFVLLKQLKSKSEVEDMLRKFIEITRPLPKAHKVSWSAKIADFFSKGKGNVKDRKSSQNDEEEPLHLLDSLWKYYVNESEYVNIETPETPNVADNVMDWYTFRSAKDLKAAGIELSLSKTPRFTDIKYNPLPLFPRSFLCLPPIIVDDSTKSSLLNLASYEMSSNRPIPYAVTSYIAFMDSLIDHPEDVAELRRSSVIFNCLGSDQMVANLFNDIAKDLVVNPSALGVVKMEIEKHYRSTMKTWINEWYYTHFRTPWTFLVFIGAFLGLGMTFVQTYLTIRNFSK